MDAPVFQQIRTNSSQVPYWTLDGDKVTLGYDITSVLFVNEPGNTDLKEKKLKVVVEGRATVEADRGALDKDEPNPSRVIRIDLLRARTVAGGGGAVVRPGPPPAPR